MARKAIKTEVWKALLARSGNRCSFPGCRHPIINESNKLVSELCHIEAAEPGGQRYNPVQSDDERNGYENLMFLCKRHHIETNDVIQYPIERLKEIKYQHESEFAENPFEIDMSLAYKLKKEMESYWNEVEESHASMHIFEELKIEVDPKALFRQLFGDARQVLSDIDDLCRLMWKSDKKTGNLENWEIYSLGIPNRTKRLYLIIVQSEIKYLEEYLVTNSSDLATRDRLEALKQEFKQLAQNAIYLD